MSKGSVAQSVKALVEPILHDENLELVDVEYKKEGRNWVLRIFIDREGGVTVEHCRRVSRLVEDLIEVEDLIPAQYVLEVSSPGLDRPLKTERDFLRYRGKRVKVSTFSPLDHQKLFTGVIRDFTDNVLILEIKDKTVRIPLNNISKAKLEIEF